MRKIIIQRYYDWDLQVVEVPEKSKMFKGQRLSTIYICEYDKALEPVIEDVNSLMKKSREFELKARERRDMLLRSEYRKQ